MRSGLRRVLVTLSAALVACVAVPLVGFVTHDDASGRGLTLVVPPDASALPPDVDAPAYAVYDPASDRFLASRDLHGRRAVGSLMKLLTADVVLQAGDLSRPVRIPPMRLASDESAIGLRPGEWQRRDVLLRAMLIVSANDAARALAVDAAGSSEAFAERMNARAAALGLADTAAANPVGLDAAGQHSSAHDIVLLGEHLMANRDFRDAVRRPEARLHGRVFPSTNDLLGIYPGTDGIKTGRTQQAGWCLLASATRGGRRMVTVVLGAPTELGRDAAATTLLDWAFTQP
jgi:D-alanyl-D-alanine carboxypeptidase (penicillin-binding protein 5/6)